MATLKRLPSSLPHKTTALVRVDFNVPFDNQGRIIDTRRITNHLPTIQFLLKQHCSVILIAHLGKPDGKVKTSLSFAPIIDQLAQLLHINITLQKLEDYQQSSEITLLENIRFYPGEEVNDKNFSHQLSQLGTIFINDAFSVSHRAHASTMGITEYLPSYAGFALEKEYNNLQSVLHNPPKPFTLLIGGKKVSDKIGVLDHFLPKVDQVLIGGACANVFYQALHKDIGKSYSETSMVDHCRELLEKYSHKIVLPEDFQVQDEMNLDIGYKTIKNFQTIISKSHTVVWAGPMGKYEDAQFNHGNEAMLDAITQPGILSIIGGGDTLAALQHQTNLQKASFLSLGGGAMLEFLAKEHLPGIDCLIQ